MVDADNPRLQFYINPAEPLEVAEFTAALGSLSRQYQEFALQNGLAAKQADARLLVNSIAPGSIDISLIPDWGLVMTSVPLMAPLMSNYEVVEKFARKIKALLDWFLGDQQGKSPSDISVRDCDDAVNIVKPIAQHGGSQTINAVNGNQTVNVLVTSAAQARLIIEGATGARAKLQTSLPAAEKRQRVAMTWSRLAREKAKTEGTKSPDHGLIEEIDPKAHAVLFTDDLSHLKNEMIADEENPLQQVYFVDVEVSRAGGGKVAAYRVTGYHGKEDLPRA